MDAESTFVIPRERGGQVILEKMTAKEMIGELAEDFFLNQNDIEYIISKIPKALSSWQNLLGLLILFTRCQRSKVPPVSYKLFCQKLKAKGYIVNLKTISRAAIRLKKRGIYPIYCPVSTISLFEAYLPFIKRELELDDEVIEETKKILQAAREKDIDIGKNPVSLIFSALYISAILCGKHRTQPEVARVGGISEVTIRKNYKELAEKLGLPRVV